MSRLRRVLWLAPLVGGCLGPQVGDPAAPKPSVARTAAPEVPPPPVTEEDVTEDNAHETFARLKREMDRDSRAPAADAPVRPPSR
jgi:hypothetical protein